MAVDAFDRQDEDILCLLGYEMDYTRDGRGRDGYCCNDSRIGIEATTN